MFDIVANNHPADAGRSPTKRRRSTVNTFYPTPISNNVTVIAATTNPNLIGCD